MKLETKCTITFIRQGEEFAISIDDQRLAWLAWDIVSHIWHATDGRPPRVFLVQTIRTLTGWELREGFNFVHKVLERHNANQFVCNPFEVNP